MKIGTEMGTGDDLPDYATVTLAFEGRIARLTLNRPERLNALNPEMLEELLDALDRVRARSGLNALFLQGAGRLFSAGVDLDTPFFMEHVEDPSVFSGTRLLNAQHRVISALFEQEVVTIAALNGHACGGGGLGLAMACDMRISVRAARFWMVPLMLDVIQDFGLSWLAQRLIGPSRAMQMAVLGQKIDADTALSWGLVNELADDAAALSERMDALAVQIEGMGSDALRMMKLILRNGERSDLRSQLGIEAVANGLTFQSEEFRQKKSDYLDALKEGRR
ncbi:enoyl-CoA hydratase/isomerase family protein [Pseudohoeflea coraliihabitans]|uniref:Enoyl-CoA hydratase/isomerase family protein n=1 Tax=Pseudohoeflea coraliihabitans TaxID=2860393 RepID=A0ABS6WJ63_9HYPH|nr:enoyl-CoA hydratase/isomerase family protein [Pseudohoeflea sp. DP4N28-3]MBW3095974.1 enoyl-CoA hydratase/isomerase family protein [Pseudohoeflea sp. DP4N28-3]